jgi:hypothetical protein
MTKYKLPQKPGGYGESIDSVPYRSPGEEITNAIAELKEAIAAIPKAVVETMIEAVIEKVDAETEAKLSRGTEHVFDADTWDILVHTVLFAMEADSVAEKDEWLAQVAKILGIKGCDE